MTLTAFFSRLSEVLDEHTWTGEVTRTHSDHDIVGRWVTYNPKPQQTWPFVRKAGMHPLERVEQALVAAKPSNVKQLRGART